jgi:hypothetical protein
MDTIERWHDYVRTRDPALLEALIDDDCTFRSPAVHSAQRGKAITCRYLAAATDVLGTADFRYTDEWRAERSAVLEFESVVGGMTVNGVDIIHWNGDGQIISFKVMARPVKGLHALIAAMAAELAA